LKAMVNPPLEWRINEDYTTLVSAAVRGGCRRVLEGIRQVGWEGHGFALSDTWRLTVA